MDEWLKLAGKTKRMPLLAGVPRVSREADSILLREGWLRWVGCLFLLAFGSVLCILFLAFPEGAVDRLGAIIGLTSGGLCLLGGIYTLLRFRGVRCFRWSSTFEVHWGLWVWPRVSTFSTDDVRARLIVERERKGLLDWNAGDTIIVLERKTDGVGVVLACSSNHERLSKVYQILQEYLNGVDETVAQVPTAQRDGMSVPRQPVHRRKAVSWFETKLTFPSADVMKLRATWGIRTTAVAAVGLGIALTIGLTLLGPVSGLRQWEIFVLLSAVVVFIAVSSIAVLTVSGPSTVVARKEARTVQLRTGLRRRENFDFDQIVVVQVCPKYMNKEKPHYYAYEMNLVLREEGSVRRVNISSETDREGVLKRCRAFAEFVGKPMLDHTAE